MSTELIVAELERARHRTLTLLEPYDDDLLGTQHSPLMSPLVWDLAHVGNYEDLWLVRALGGPGVRPDIDDLYDAFRHPRASRRALELLRPAPTRRYLAEVRAQALDRLGDLGEPDADPLTRDHFVHRMVIEHEHQHAETMLATIQLIDPATGARLGVRPPAPLDGIAPGESGIGGREVLVEGGVFVMGVDDDPWALDNERPSREIDVAPFWIDATPVDNRTYLAFVSAGGYDDARWWSPQGWQWRHEANLSAPEFWSQDRGQWSVWRFGCLVPIALDEPVQHVCWYEADACARWLGKRLPTETEWEKAAAWDPVTSRRRRFPWGDSGPDATRANLGQVRLGPVAVGALPDGASALGIEQLVGDVWEWTSSTFAGHPGYRSFPYREYSEVFFDQGYKVLRGGSWATDPTVARSSFRNWDLPVRRQIFAGFRCARDA